MPFLLPERLKNKVAEVSSQRIRRTLFLVFLVFFLLLLVGRLGDCWLLGSTIWLPQKKKKKKKKRRKRRRSEEERRRRKKKKKTGQKEEGAERAKGIKGRRRSRQEAIAYRG